MSGRKTHQLFISIGPESVLAPRVKVRASTNITVAATLSELYRVLKFYIMSGQSGLIYITCTYLTNVKDLFNYYIYISRLTFLPLCMTRFHWLYEYIIDNSTCLGLTSVNDYLKIPTRVCVCVCVFVCVCVCVGLCVCVCVCV